MPLAKPGPRCSKRRGRLARHAAIAIGGAGHHAFEQGQHRPDRALVQRRDEMHFRSAGIGEADFDPAGNQRFDHTLRRRSCRFPFCRS